MAILTSDSSTPLDSSLQTELDRGIEKCTTSPGRIKVRQYDMSFKNTIFSFLFVLAFPFSLILVQAVTEEFVAVDDDIANKAPIMADKDILEFVQSLKNIIDSHTDDENEMNKATLVRTSSEMKNILKSMRSYLDAHFSGELNNKMDDIEQCVDNLMLNREILDYIFS
ncbi:hypothetical protein TNCV_1240511 [Trichonephila clavipes]|uniref:Uncharacterized protein n=1 Tax=Trichonephila clavipes TaxID=2585209 RepID=A0A8X6WE67_TRICX|nr:hypothetical protein TNCV_1240511 [Trichonephila clavipes]